MSGTLRTRESDLYGRSLHELCPDAGSIGTLGICRASDTARGHREILALNWEFYGGRGRYRTADRWCVKPELYH